MTHDSMSKPAQSAERDERAVLSHANEEALVKQYDLDESTVRDLWEEFLGMTRSASTQSGEQSVQVASATASRATELKRVVDLLDAHLGDTDPVIGDDMTQEEIETEYPVMAAMQILVGLMTAAQPESGGEA